MEKIICATCNAGKMKEIREILKDLQVSVTSMKEEGMEGEIVEDGLTFEENAIIKAKAIVQLLKCREQEAVVLADDSGLEIDCLNREPGIYSARYMGRDTSYRIKNQNLMKRLEGVPKEKRTARFVCVVAAVLPKGDVLVTRGVIEGKIGYEERGENGFGYDPIFFLSDMSRSTAQMSPEEKNMISHRGQALRAMREKLRTWYGQAAAAPRFI